MSTSPSSSEKPPATMLEVAERWANEAVRTSRDGGDVSGIAQAFALIAIADEIKALREFMMDSTTQCGHGTVGFCAACLATIPR